MKTRKRDSYDRTVFVKRPRVFKVKKVIHELTSQQLLKNIPCRLINI
tara:strand:- start:490 stop:630 length:141 start_codon:yes stop_codon:yes gene_type:complete